MTTRKRRPSREEDDDLDKFVDDEIEGEDDDESVNGFVNNLIKGERRASGDPPPKKKLKEAASPSNTIAVLDGASPSTVYSKVSFNPQALVPIRRLSFSNDQKGAPESRIVTKRLKDLCSMKEPTVNVGIEIVGAAYLLKQMTTKRPSCDDDDVDDDDKIGPALKQAVEATKLLFHADHLRNNALQLLSKSQELFDKFL